MSHATLLIEAAPKSGTLITARLAADYNRDLLVVPGNIFSENSKGVHQFLKLGATPVTCAEDILLTLGIEPKGAERSSAPTFLPPLQQQILTHLTEPRTTDELIRLTAEAPSRITVTLIEMELSDLITKQGNRYRKSI